LFLFSVASLNFNILLTFDPELYKLLLLSRYNGNKNDNIGDKVTYLSGQVVLYILYIIFMLYFSTISLSMELSLCKNAFGFHEFNNVNFVHSASVINPIPIARLHCKLLFVIICLFVMLQYQSSSYCGKGRSVSPLKFIFSRCKKKCSKFICCISLWFALLNFLLITVVNPGLLNPGPNKLSVLYQNVQGLIPFSALSDTHPSLNMNKILELQSYLNINQPDIVVLNETW